MNDTAKIFALALASNDNPQQHFKTAFEKISTLGETCFSSIYLIPCRDGVGADYWNAACLLNSDQTPEQILLLLKQMEAASGRIRPSHQISLDIDLIAWGKSLDTMQFNPKKLPLAVDVKIPLYELWPESQLKTQAVFPRVGHSVFK